MTQYIQYMGGQASTSQRRSAHSDTTNAQQDIVWGETELLLLRRGRHATAWTWVTDWTQSQVAKSPGRAGPVEMHRH